MKSKLGHFSQEAVDKATEDFSERYDLFDFKLCKRNSDGSIYGIPDKSSCSLKDAKEVKKNVGIEGGGILSSLKLNQLEGEAKKKNSPEVVKFLDKLGPDGLNHAIKKSLEKNTEASGKLAALAVARLDKLNLSQNPKAKMPNLSQFVGKEPSKDFFSGFLSETLKFEGGTRISSELRARAAVIEKGVSDFLRSGGYDPQKYDATKRGRMGGALETLEALGLIDKNEAKRGYEAINRLKGKFDDSNMPVLGDMRKISKAMERAPEHKNWEGEYKKQFSKQRAKPKNEDHIVNLVGPGSRRSSPSPSSSSSQRGAKKMSSAETQSQYTTFYRMARNNGQGHSDAVESAKGMLDVSARTNGVEWDRSGLTGSFRSSVRKSYE